MGGRDRHIAVIGELEIDDDNRTKADDQGIIVISRIELKWPLRQVGLDNILSGQLPVNYAFALIKIL